MQRQTKPPKKPVVSSVFFSKKAGPIVVYDPNQQQKKQPNSKLELKPDSSKNATKEHVKPPPIEQSRPSSTCSSLTQREQRKKERKQRDKSDSKDSSKEQWQRGQQLKQQKTSGSSEEQWQRGEQLFGANNDTGSDKTLHRRNQRIKARKLKRAESTATSESQESQQKQRSKSPKQERSVEQAKLTATSDSQVRRQKQRSKSPKQERNVERAKSTVTTVVQRSQPKQRGKTPKQERSAKRVKWTATEGQQKQLSKSPKQERNAERAKSTTKADSQKNRKKKRNRRRKKSEKKQKQERSVSKAASGSQKSQQKKQSKGQTPKVEKPALTPSKTASSRKVHNAWSKPLSLVRSVSTALGVTPKKEQKPPEKEQKPRKKDRETPKEVPGPIKQEQEQVTDTTSKAPALLPQANSYYTPPRIAPSRTNTYPRVTPLPVHTYPSRIVPTHTRHSSDSVMDWRVSPHLVVAMDCEMVGVGKDGKRSMLARVSLVDWNGDVLVDTFVAPTEYVTDYRTFVSGIRPHHLISPQAMDFQACRTLVRTWLQEKPILVGHGLNNDLDVLHLTHPWHLIRDSATYRPFTKPCCRGACPKRLKVLAKDELGISIQQDGVEHCSVVDARTVMELYKRKQTHWDLYVRDQRNYVLNCPLRDLQRPYGRGHSM